MWTKYVDHFVNLFLAHFKLYDIMLHVVYILILRISFIVCVNYDSFINSKGFIFTFL